MPVSIDSNFIREAWYNDTSTFIHSQHPHPLRSHGRPENILAADDGNDANSIRADSFVLPRTDPYHEQRRRSLQSVSIGRDDEEDVVPPVPQIPPQAFVVGSAQKRFGDPAYPVIPVRPPLRPTVSWGGVSKYSYSSDVSELGKHQSIAVSVVEEASEPSRMQRHWRDYACLACLALMNFMCDISATAMATALPSVTTDLHLKSLDTFWIPGSFLLASALAQPLFMRLSGAIGSKACLLLGLLLFTLGSLVSAVAADSTGLLMGRSIEGFGAGAVTVLAQQISTQLSRDTKLSRRHSQSRQRLFWLGLVLGPIIGGAMAQHASWRNVFWFQIHLSAIGLITLTFLLRLPFFDPGAGFRRLLRIDLLGWALLCLSVVPLLVALSWAGATYSWASWHTLVPLIICLVSLSVWTLYNRYRMEPILPISIFYSTSAVISCSGAAVLGGLVMMIVYFVPMYFRIDGMSSTISGLSLTPWTLGLMIGSFMTGFFVKTTGNHWIILPSWAMLTLTTGLMVLGNQLSTPAFFIPIGLACGIAIGSLFICLSTAVQFAASNDDETIHAIPLYTFFTTLGQAIGLTIGSTIFRNLSGDTPVASVDSLQPIWILAAALAGIMLFLSLWFVRERRPRPHVLL